MPEQGEQELFSPSEGRGLPARLRDELRGLKGWSPQSSLAQLRASFAPDAEEDRLPFRLARGARDFSAELKARPREVFLDFFTPSHLLGGREGAWPKILLGSAAGHAAAAALLLLSGALAPLFIVKEVAPQEQYEVTMLAPTRRPGERLERAPWLPPLPEAFDPLAAPLPGEAAVVQTPATIPVAPTVIRQPRRRAVASNPAAQVIESAPMGDPGDGATDSASATTPTPTPTPGSATSGNSAAAASNRGAGGQPATSPTPGAASSGNGATNVAANTPEAARLRLRELVSRTYAGYQKPAPPAQAQQPTPSPAAVVAVAEFKIEPNGQLADVKLVTPSNAPDIDAALTGALGELGELRSFQSLAKLSQQNSLRLTLDESASQIVLSCTAASPQLADAMTPVLAVVARDIAAALGGPGLAAQLGERLKVGVEGNRVDAVLGLTNAEAAALVAAHLTTAPAPVASPTPAGNRRRRNSR